MDRRRTCGSDAWRRAHETYEHLQRGGRLGSVSPLPAPALLPAAGETAVGMFTSGLRFSQRLAGPAPAASSGAPVLIGPPQFVAGYLLTGLALRGTRRRRAQRAAEPQWRTMLLRRVVVTTGRLWCEVATAEGPRWGQFDYPTITDIRLDGNALTLSFLHAAPVRLTGELAPWCAAVIAHHRYGREAPVAAPTVHQALSAASAVPAQRGPVRDGWRGYATSPARQHHRR